MEFHWNAHRFSGGTLAFDLANTVILRDSATGRVDRLASPAAFAEFTKGAMAHCHERFDLSNGIGTADFGRFIAFRECIDGHFRALAQNSHDARASIGEVLTQAGRYLCEATPDSLAQAVSISAAGLAMDAHRGLLNGHIKLCGNCGWLLLDQSRNRSRNWCDMSVCGNRQKARRHYRRQKQEASL